MITFSTSIILYGVCQFIYNQNLTHIAYALGINKEIEAGFIEFVTGLKKAFFIHFAAPQVTTMSTWYGIANTHYFTISLTSSLLFIESLITYGVNDITVWFNRGVFLSKDEFFSSPERKLLSFTKPLKKITKLTCSIGCKSSFNKVLCTPLCDDVEDISENTLAKEASSSAYKIDTYKFMCKSFTVGLREILLDNTLLGKTSIIPHIYYAAALAYHKMQDVTHQNNQSSQEKKGQIQIPKIFSNTTADDVCIYIELFDDKDEQLLQERKKFFCEKTNICLNEHDDNLIPLIGKLFDIIY